jgi:FG-GAP-like repeat/Abnormal spindle-like microcephaly-assoc'd, ASPM-SPD-2-Hydin
VKRYFERNVGGGRWLAVVSLAAIWSLCSPVARASSNPVPYIDSISPVATVAGGTSSVSLTVTGVNFTATSVIQVTLDGATTPSLLPTTFVSATQLTATLPSADTAKDGTALVTVSNGLGQVSNAVELPITHSTGSLSLTFRETEKAPSGGVHPYLPVVGDFNEDGKLDIAVSNDVQSCGSGPPAPPCSVSVFLGTAGGSFQGASNWPVGQLPEGLAVGDFDHNGHLDLAVANTQDASVSVLLGNGDGTFQTGLTTTLTTGTQPYLVVAGDFNGDGLVDLAVACLGTHGDNAGFVTILIGNGDGTFAAGPANYGTIAQPAGLAMSDFDGNGTLDLAVTDAVNNEVWIVFGDGDGTFSSGTSYPTKVVTDGPAGIVAADFNGDGKPDLAVAYPNDPTYEISVLLNSAGTFPAHTEYQTAADGMFLAAADLNGDGITDLVVPSATSNIVSVLLGNASSGVPNGTFGNLTSSVIDPSFTSVTGIAAADFNADGRLDLAFTAVPNGEVAVLVQAPQMEPSSSSLSFGNQTKGTQSAPQTVTLANTGGAPLTFYSIKSTDPTDFPETSNCPTPPTTLEPGTSCTVNVMFAPSTSGSLSASLTIADNVTGFSTPQIVSLSGTGLAPLAGVSTSSLTFGNQLVGKTLGPQAVTLSNTGNSALTITGIAVSNGFSQTNTCGSSVAVNSTCTINVSFAPTTSGAASGTLTVTDNSGESAGSTQTVSLSGTGIAPAGLAAASLTFTNQLVSTISAAQTLTVSNSNSTALSITGITITGANGGDFSETNTCGTSLAAGTNCTISVSFKPTAGGTRTGTISVTENASGAASSTQSAILTGTGIAPAGLTPSSLTFAVQTLGTSATQILTLSNTNSVALSITSIAITGANGGDFSETNTCGTSLAAGANCAITVSFKPTATGIRTGTVSVTENATGAASSTQSVSLTGTGVAPVAGVAPSSLTFAGQLVGSTSASQLVTLSNTGTVALSLSSITASGNFAQTNTCGTSVAPGATCAINVTFAPASVGTLTGSLTITDNSAGVAASTQTVSLTGTGTAPGVKLSASSLTFGDENEGTASAGLAVTVTNTGTATLTLTSVTAGGDFSESNTCGSSLPAGASCTVTVTFKPTALFSRTGTLTITDNVSPGTQSVSLSGTGLGAEPSISPSALTFKGALVGSSSTAQIVILKNVGNTAMTVEDLAVSGDFSETTTCGASLAANASCTISVTFKPTAGGTRSGALTLSAGGSHSIGLSGVGQDFSFSGTTTGSVTPGQSASYNLSATPAGGLSGAIALSCSGAPSKATCTVSPGSVTLTGSSATNFQVTVATTASSGLLNLPRTAPPSQSDRNRWLLLGLVMLAGMMLLARRRPEAMFGRLRLGVATAGMLVVLALGLVGCGGSSYNSPSSNPGTPTGKYNLTVTGTLTSGSVTVSHDVQVTLQVQ